MHAEPLRRQLVIAAAALATFVASGAFAAGTPQQKCQAGKNDAAGKYAACIGKAEKGLVSTLDVAAYDEAVLKCEGKLIGSWSKLEAAAVAAGSSCPSTGDQSAIEDFLASCSDSVAGALAGGALGVDPVTCAADLSACAGEIAACDDDITTCNAALPTCEADLAASDAALAACEGDLASCYATASRIPRTGQTSCHNDVGAVIACAGSGRDGEFQAGDAPSFVDNGNGTITDNLTGLMWEKLSDDGSIHDKDTSYAGLTAAIGKATAVNGANFAGHNDWRVPNLRELASIPIYQTFNPAVPPIFHSGCVAGCTVLTCSCTKANVYFTSTHYQGYQPAGWKINMYDGDIYAGDKVDSHYVRLVRTAN